MNKKTLTALQKSIEKWERVIRLENVYEEKGLLDCALCDLFFFEPNYCRGCPVEAVTGLRGCFGTPYVGFSTYKAFLEIEKVPWSSKAAIWARKELNFLKSLLPKE
jgi:hypothetical protein